MGGANSGVFFFFKDLQTDLYLPQVRNLPCRSYHNKKKNAGCIEFR